MAISALTRHLARSGVSGRAPRRSSDLRRRATASTCAERPAANSPALSHQVAALSENKILCSGARSVRAECPSSRESAAPELRNTRVQLLAARLEEGLVGSVLDQGMLEGVDRFWRGALSEDQFG